MGCRSVLGAVAWFISTVETAVFVFTVSTVYCVLSVSFINIFLPVPPPPQWHWFSCSFRFPHVSLFLEQFCRPLSGSPYMTLGVKGASLLQRNHVRHPSPVSFESYPDDDRRGTPLKNGGRAHQGSRGGVSPVPQYGEHNAMFRSGGEAEAKKYRLVTSVGCVGA